MHVESNNRIKPKKLAERISNLAPSHMLEGTEGNHDNVSLPSTYRIQAGTITAWAILLGEWGSDREFLQLRHLSWGAQKSGNTSVNVGVKTQTRTLDLGVPILFSTHRWGAGRNSDSLRAGRSGDLFPARARFFVPVQTDPGAHPASCTMGTGSLSRK